MIRRLAAVRRLLNEGLALALVVTQPDADPFERETLSLHRGGVLVFASRTEHSYQLRGQAAQKMTFGSAWVAPQFTVFIHAEICVMTSRVSRHHLECHAFRERNGDEPGEAAWFDNVNKTRSRFIILRALWLLRHDSVREIEAAIAAIETQRKLLMI